MTHNNEAAGGRAGGRDGTGARTRPGPLQYTTTRPGGQPVFSAGGRIVGVVRDGVLRKRVRGSVHFLRRPPAIAWDTVALEQARALGATRCEVRDVETGVVYVAPLDALDRYGFDLDRGHGLQRALPLDRWTVTEPGEPQAVQLALGLEVEP